MGLRRRSTSSTAGRFKVAAAAGAGVVVLETVWLLAELGGPRATQAFSDLVDIPVLVVAAVACWAASRRESGRTRSGWILLGAGLVSWAVGESIWSYYELFLGVEVPFPSLADVGFLGLIPFTAWAMLSFPAAPRGRAGRTRALLDGTIIVTSLFALSWAIVLGPAYRAGADGVAEQILGLAYPFGDAVLIGVVLFVAARATRTERVGISLIGAGLVAIALADSLFTYLTFNQTYATGSLMDVGWTVGFVLIGLGALRPPHTSHGREEKPSSILAAVLPYAAVFVGVPVAALQFASHGTLDPVVFFLGIALFIAIGVRQLMILLENVSLARHLDAKLKERTAELESALEQLGATRRLQDEFVSNANHELRTPLTVMIGALDTLARPEQAIWQHAPMLIEMARRGAGRMNQLVDDLLLASGITDIHGSRRAPFDLSEHVRFSLLTFEPAGKAIETRLCPGLRAVGDAGRFQDALGHLLSNADKFGPDGSTIRVEVGSEGDAVSVLVRDEGSGIPQSLREAVFDRFYQGDGSSTRRYGGMGLGLYLAREVMKMMGGDVTIDDVRRGCAVRIRLPVASETSASDLAADDDLQSRVRGPQSRLDPTRHLS